MFDYISLFSQLTASGSSKKKFLEKFRRSRAVIRAPAVRIFFEAGQP
jgi:hypothetical protein